MKTKKINFKKCAAIGLLALSPSLIFAQGKLGGLKEKAKEKVGGSKESNTTTESSSSSSSSTSTNATASVGSKGIKVSSPTVIMTTEFGGSTNSTNFEPGQDIFVRFAFPKPIGNAYAESQGMSDVPSTGSYYIVVAKNQEDENPIIMMQNNVFTSRYTKAEDNTMDFVLQGSDALFTKLEGQGSDVTKAYTFNSIQTLANKSLSEEWKRQAGLFQVKNYEWEIMLIFIPYNDDDESKVKLMCTQKFNYNVTADNKKKIADGMNFYDKQRFEKTPDDGMTTAIHKNNVGKIVFSNEKMTKTFDDASKVKTSFSNFSGGIYSRMYLKESMRNLFAEYGNGKDISESHYRLYFYVDGASEYSCYEDSKLSQDETHKMTNWMIVFAPLNKEDYEYDAGCVNRFAYVMSELKAGKHKIKVVAKSFVDNDNEVELASGEFEINIADADRDAFVKKYGAQLPEKGLLATDTKLAAEIKKLAPSAIDVRCPNVWEDRKDAWGTITHRTTIVAYSYKDKNGRGKQDTFMVRQVKFANGWGETTFDNEEKAWYGLDEYLPLQNSK